MKLLLPLLCLCGLAAAGHAQSSRETPPHWQLKTTATLYSAHQSTLTQEAGVNNFARGFIGFGFVRRELAIGPGLYIEREGNRSIFSLGIPYLRWRNRTSDWPGRPNDSPPLSAAKLDRSEIDWAIRFEYALALPIGEEFQLGLGLGTQYFYYRARNVARSDVPLEDDHRLSGSQFFPTLFLNYRLHSHWQIHAGVDPVVLSIALDRQRSQWPATTETNQLFDLDLLFGNNLRLGVIYQFVNPDQSE